MNYLRRKVAVDRRGFTLIELVVVIAILGILAAVAIPIITSYLSDAKERSYNSDRGQFDLAVKSYYGQPGNARFIGKRQYPIYGQDNSGLSGPAMANVSTTITDLAASLGIPGTNPQGGTVGGTPSWDDGDGDGDRTTTGEKLFHPSFITSTASTDDHWNTAAVTRGTTEYMVDSRDYFINFDELKSADYLEVPDSASPDNATSGTGSYSWFVTSDGRIECLYYFFPVSTNTGYQEVYP